MERWQRTCLRIIFRPWGKPLNTWSLYGRENDDKNRDRDDSDVSITTRLGRNRWNVSKGKPGKWRRAVDVNGGYNGEGARAYGEDEETVMVWLMDRSGGEMWKGKYSWPAIAIEKVSISVEKFVTSCTAKKNLAFKLGKYFYFFCTLGTATKTWMSNEKNLLSYHVRIQRKRVLA